MNKIKFKFKFFIYFYFIYLFLFYHLNKSRRVTINKRIEKDLLMEKPKSNAYQGTYLQLASSRILAIIP